MRFTRIVALAISTLSSSISFAATWNDTDKYFMIEHYELGGTYA